MFIGHFAVALAAKRVAPRTSLGTLTLAALFLDALWPVFLLLGIERAEITPGRNSFLLLNFSYYPISHSLLMAIVWSAFFKILYNARTKYLRGAVWVGLLVLSHWILDFIVHVPDLPLWPGGPKVGLGLWNYPAATIVVESAMFLAGIWIYLATTRPRNIIGKASFWAYVIVVAGLYAADATSQAPPNITIVAYIGIIAWIFIPWTYWIEYNREVRAGDALGRVSGVSMR